MAEMPVSEFLEPTPSRSSAPHSGFCLLAAGTGGGLEVLVSSSLLHQPLDVNESSREIHTPHVNYTHQPRRQNQLPLTEELSKHCPPLPSSACSEGRL